MVAGYERLQVWERAHSLALQVYELTKDFPRSEIYGLSAQLRRSAVSVPTNIAEGHARASRREYLQFCFMARGSLAETRYLMRVALDLGYVTMLQYKSAIDKCEEVARMLNGLMRFLGKARLFERSKSSL